MCNKRYISKPQNKEIGSVSGKTDSPMSLLSCSRFSGWIPIWSMDAIPHNPSYSASFSPLIFLLHYPFLISLYLWLNMYFSKDADSIPTFESPWIHRGWTPAMVFLIFIFELAGVFIWCFQVWTFFFQCILFVTCQYPWTSIFASFKIFEEFSTIILPSILTFIV